MCISDTYLINYTPKHINPLRNRINIACVCETCISDMLLQYDLNKWRLKQLSNFEKIYIYAASTRLLKISKKYDYEYNNQIFPKNSHIHIKVNDDAPSYHCPSPIPGPKIPKWGCILKSFSGCPIMKAPDLESLKHIYTPPPQPVSTIK